MESYAKKIRASLSELTIKQKCCRRCYEAGLCGSDDYKLVCRSCYASFLRGVFVSRGTMTDPDKSNYHLEMAFESEKYRDAVYSLMSESDIPAKKGTRKERYTVYIKDGNVMQDFCALIGANTAAFDIINSRIRKDISNAANRATNCDTSNIKRSLDSSKKQNEIIEKLYSAGMISSLEKELAEMAKIRLENEQLSLSELGMLCNPPLTKSGVCHRMQRLIKKAQELLK